MATTVNKKVKCLILLPGDASEEIRKSINEHLEFYSVKDMKEAVDRAYEIAKPGDTVLLSPGAASFNLFKHEFDRGDKFGKLVGSLS